MKNTPADDRPTGGNWLKIYDARGGKTLYIAKKPLTNGVSWDDLFKAGVVYGTDQIDISKIQPDGTIKQEAPYTGDKGYKPKIIKIKDSSGKEKTYIVRLLKGHNPNIYKGDPNKKITELKSKDVIQGSEWNRYILPLVKDYRIGASTNNNDYIEEALRKTKKQGANIPIDEYLGDKNDYTIQLASYNWFVDLTLGTDSSTKPYKYRGTYVKNFGYYGQRSMTQEYFKYDNYRSNRGGVNSNTGANYISCQYTKFPDDECGFRPVLEEIE